MLSAPEYLDDVAPPAAAAIALARQVALEWLARHEYQLVMLPLADYLETLTGGDADVDLHTFKMTDTLSGRTLGVRADLTPQVVRFDAECIDKAAVRRYCYCAPTLRTRPVQPWLGRESLQLGAEVFGTPAGGGDWEVASVALGMLRAIGLNEVCVELGHAGLFAAAVAGVPADAREALTDWVSRRDGARVGEVCDAFGVDEEARKALAVLATGEGTPAALAEVTAVLPAAGEAVRTLDEVRRRLVAEGGDCALSLSDLGSFGYHSGVVFTMYAADRVVARGGRYRLRGGVEGAGFGVDLRAVRDLPAPPSSAPPVWVAAADAEACAEKGWLEAVARLRRDGRAVRFCYDGEEEGGGAALRRGADGEWGVVEAVA